MVETSILKTSKRLCWQKHHQRFTVDEYCFIVEMVTEDRITSTVGDESLTKEGLPEETCPQGKFLAQWVRTTPRIRQYVSKCRKKYRFFH